MRNTCASRSDSWGHATVGRLRFLRLAVPSGPALHKHTSLMELTRSLMRGCGSPHGRSGRYTLSSMEGVWVKCPHRRLGKYLVISTEEGCGLSVPTLHLEFIKAWMQTEFSGRRGVGEIETNGGRRDRCHNDTAIGNKYA